MADFLEAAAVQLNDPAIRSLGEHYARLGEQWSELADTTLPDSVPQLAEAKRQLAAYAEHFNSGGSVAELAECWRSIQEIERQVRQKFPLTLAECAELRSQLRERVLAIHVAEEAAREQLAGVG